MLAPTANRSLPLRPAPAPKPRLLLISDSDEGLRKLQCEISPLGFELTCIRSREELRAACRDYHDLVVLDVGPPHIASLLKLLRTSPHHTSIPLLVESSRIYTDLSLVGVLPFFRAMPCTQAEMVMLIKSLREVADSDTEDSKLF